jgi:hypothetical protein
LFRTGILAFLVTTPLAGCRSITYMRSSPTVYQPKPKNCPLQVLTLPPQRPFVELGTFDITNTGDGRNVETTAELLKAVGERACQEGADAIVGAKSGTGLYVQASAIKWQEVPATTAAAPPEPPPQSKAP